jgi:hypothetical protein
MAIFIILLCMETNDIKKWEPIDSIPEILYLEGLYDDYEGFRLLLRSENHSKMMRIMFKSYLGYTNIDESYMLKTINESLALCQGWPLFFSHNTDFVKWGSINFFV